MLYVIENKSGRSMYCNADKAEAVRFYLSHPRANLIRVYDELGEQTDILQPNVAVHVTKGGHKLSRIFRNFSSRREARKKAADLRGAGYITRCIMYLHGFQVFAAKPQTKSLNQ